MFRAVLRSPVAASLCARPGAVRLCSGSGLDWHSTPKLIVLDSWEAKTGLATLRAPITLDSSYMPWSMASITADDVLKHDIFQHDDVDPLEILRAVSRTYQPSVIRRKRRHGFLKRNSSVGGKKVLQRRRERGRKVLTIRRSGSFGVRVNHDKECSGIIGKAAAAGKCVSAAAELFPLYQYRDATSPRIRPLHGEALPDKQTHTVVMPAKKKTSAEPKAAPVRSDHVPLVLDPDDEEWVTLELKLVNWPFLDFQLRVKTDAALFSIKKKLRERHGRMEEMRLYKESPSADCELTNEMLTLEQAGIEGAPKNEVPVKLVTLWYDFKPHDHSEPLLLVAKSRDE